MLLPLIDLERAVLGRAWNLVTTGWKRFRRRAPSAQAHLRASGVVRWHPPAPVSQPGAPIPPLSPGQPAQAVAHPPVKRSPKPARSSDRLRALRRAAAFDLFRRCDLGPPPAALWPFVGDDNAVGDGVARFLVAIDHDPVAGPWPHDLLRVEHRQAGDPAADGRLRDAVVSGDRAQVIAALATLSRLAAPPPPWPAAQLVSRATLGTRSGLVLEEAAHAAAEQAQLRRRLSRQWPEHWLGTPAANQVAKIVDLYDEAGMRLLQALAQAPADAEAQLAILVDQNAALAAFEQAASNAEPFAAPPAGGGGPTSGSGHHALADLVQQLDRTTDAAEATQAWQRFRWQQHDARPGLDAGKRARAVRLGAAANRALDRWEASARLGRGTP